MSNENICGICWNDVGEDKVKTPCLHIYCTKCFFLWMKENSNCPMCRASFGSNEIRARREQLRNLDNSILDQHFAYQTIRNNNERLQRKNERLQRRNERLEYKNARLYDRKRTLVSHITTRYIELTSLNSERRIIREALDGITNYRTEWNQLWSSDLDEEELMPNPPPSPVSDN
jgi:hypothetical protein